MPGDHPINSGTAQANYGGGQQCFSCGCSYYGPSHSCLGQLGGEISGISWIPSAPALTVADVESVVAKALEDHAKKYLAIIEKLADALAGKK